MQTANENQPAASAKEEISMEKLNEEIKTQVLFSWKALSRPFKVRTREFYTTAGSIIFLLCIIFIFLKEFLLVMAIIAFSFFVYILSTVKPEEVENQITNKGIFNAGKLYFWDQLGRFWFGDSYDSRVLFIENFEGLPPRLILLINHKDEENITTILKKYLINQKPTKSQLEKAGEWLVKKVPLESTTKP
ncbi:hypothetical protein GYA19_05320, partial [Candidatus Beckwithbacteria bacterium]|nr:hypothetical protein [Candidatus Beckwithbacteria bacterium]